MASSRALRLRSCNGLRFTTAQHRNGLATLPYQKKILPLAPDNPAVATAHQPPLLVRAALVSATTALATPALFPLGVLHLALRTTITDAELRQTSEARWGALLSFMTWTFLPSMHDGAAASLVLPVAVGNALSVGVAYGAVDLARRAGSVPAADAVLRRPLVVGGIIGGMAGYVGPHYLYGPILERLYALDGASQSLAYVMDQPIATGVSVATGAVFGVLLQPLLHFSMNGLPGTPWGVFSGAALAAASSALAGVYTMRKSDGLPVPAGGYIDPSQVEHLNSVLRYNRASGVAEAYSQRTRQYLGPADDAAAARRTADACRSHARAGKAVIDDRLLAFAYNYWDKSVGWRHPEHVVSVRTATELRRAQNSLALTDAAVTLLLGSDAKGDVRNGAADASNLNQALKILEAIELDYIRTEKQLSPKLKQLEKVSIPIELLMIARLQKQECTSENIPVSTLERYVRRLCPEIILYTSDEQYAGESIELQLQNANWKGPDTRKALAKWQWLHGKDGRHAWRKRALVATTGLLLTVAGWMLQGAS